MPFIGDGEYQELNHHELMFIRADGSSDVWCYGYQPTTNDIAERAHPFRRYTLCVQKVGEMYEVYDLSTLKRMGAIGMPVYTIGMPVATHENVDAAIMAAVLLA